MLFWNFRYLDRNDRQLKDRDLYLNTRSLDPSTRAAVEFVAESKSVKTVREIVKFRYLFMEGMPDRTEYSDDWKHYFVGPTDYFEDEEGNEISGDQIGQILTGNDNAREIPSGAKQHDIEYMFSEPKPEPLADIVLTAEEVKMLGYFSRDLREMQTTAFMKDGPGSLKTSDLTLSMTSTPVLETAVSDEEIRSFVTIFRRLYMEVKEPASFAKIVPIFVRVLGDHPLSNWVAGATEDYQSQLDSVPDTMLYVPKGTFTFPTKRLIDVFLYTQYAHQPSDDRQRQFVKCLAQVYDKHSVLTWMFLTEIYKLSWKIIGVGKVINRWFMQYCDYHKVAPDILASIRDHHVGLGAAEKQEDRIARLFKEKAEQLAIDLWEKDGRPIGGYVSFIADATKRLSQELDVGVTHQSSNESK